MVHPNISTYGSEVDITGVTTQAGLVTATESIINGYATSQSYTLSEGIIWPSVTTSDVNALIATAVPARAVSTETRSIVTGTGATGFQVSSTRDAIVNYNVTIATTATIGGSATGVIALEMASTNSATPGDWVEVGRVTNGQSISLAIALQSIQTLGQQLGCFVPAGYYLKLRSINTSGTPTYTYNSGQKVIL